MTRSKLPLLLAGTFALVLAACGSSGASGPGPTYGPSGAQFRADFASTPHSDHAKLAGFSGLTSSTDYWSGPAQDPLSSPTHSGLASDEVIVIRFENEKDALDTIATLKLQALETYQPMASVPGDKAATGAVYSGRPAGSSGYVGIEYVQLGRTDFIVISSNPTSLKAVRAFDASFALLPADGTGGGT